MPGKGRVKDRKAIALRLRNAREAAGLTQTELGLKIGRPQTFVSKIELGERSLSLLDAQQICASLQISVDSLLGQVVTDEDSDA